MKGACESAPVGVMLGNVALLLHFYLTAKMEDFIAKLKQFSKLDFQSKREMINNGRPMPELKGQKEPTPFVIEWIPDILPHSRVGELRLRFEYGHQPTSPTEH